MHSILPLHISSGVSPAPKAHERCHFVGFTPTVWIPFTTSHYGEQALQLYWPIIGHDQYVEGWDFFKENFLLPPLS